jgi:hypothetical protein
MVSPVVLRRVCCGEGREAISHSHTGVIHQPRINSGCGCIDFVVQLDELHPGLMLRSIAKRCVSKHEAARMLQ